MEKLSNKVSSKTLRRSIQDIICNVEIVMTGIQDLLGEMGRLVQQIDHTTEKLESKFGHRLKEQATPGDTSQSHCDTGNLMLPPSSAKQMLPSPFMDFTYLDLMSNCEVCNLEVGKFSYNDKYPLWIQYDTWHTGNTTSDMSIVSADSDITKSAKESNNNSWKSSPLLEDCLHIENDHIVRTKQKNGDNLTKFGFCCNGETEFSSSYCGVYEQMMEELLESEYLYCEAPKLEDRDSNFDNSEIKSNYSLSLSDEHIVHYNRSLNTWTAFKTENAFSDYSCSTCS